MTTTKETVKALDAGLRHRVGKTNADFVQHYCKEFREHAYATRDDSWNEFEKLITHVLGMLIYHKRFCQILGLPEGFDPRDMVDDFDDAEKTMKAAREKVVKLLQEQTP